MINNFVIVNEKRKYIILILFYIFFQFCYNDYKDFET